MNHKMYIPRSGLKKRTIPDSLNQTTISEQKGNCNQNEDKSNFEKYLNFYESIQKKETINTKQNTSFYIWKGKKCTKVKNGIFSNRLIQNSYPKNPNEELEQLLKKYNQKNQNIAKVGVINERLKSVPSKKNQIALKMIAENKISPERQQSIKKNKEKNINVRGILIQTPNHQNKDNFSYNVHKDQQDETHQTQSCWRNNSFVGFNVTKAYNGYFKTKNKKKYSKEQQRRLRNSTAFIDYINKSIQHHKYKKMITRPQVCHIEGRDFLRQVKIQSNNFSLSSSYGFESQEKTLKIQSEAKLKSFRNDPSSINNVKQNQCYEIRIGKQKVKTNNNVRFLSNGKQKKAQESQNDKMSLFHSRIHQFSKNSSFHVESNNLIVKSIDKLSVTAQTFCKEIKPSEQVALSNRFQDENLHSKKLFKKRFRNRNSGCQFNKYLSTNNSFQTSRIQRRSHQITLNKIQESIQKDVQIIIQQINVKR